MGTSTMDMDYNTRKCVLLAFFIRDIIANREGW